jgi:hypothetical protein
MCSARYLRSNIVLVPSLSDLLISDKDGQFPRSGCNRARSPYVYFSCQANDSTREASAEAIFRQWQLPSSGTPWVASTCEYIRTPSPTAYSIIMNRPSASSWEFVTTLDYEWSVIRRRRPYRWTIGVRDDSHLLLVPLPDPEI